MFAARNRTRSASLLATELDHQVADFLVEDVRLLPGGSLAVHSHTVLGATEMKASAQAARYT